jgi:hypothetical protein
MEKSCKKQVIFLASKVDQGPTREAGLPPGKKMNDSCTARYSSTQHTVTKTSHSHYRHSTTKQWNLGLCYKHPRG